MRIPTERSIERFYCRIVNSQRAQARVRIPGQFGDAFEGVNLRSQTGEHRGLIAGAGANLKNSHVIVEFKQLSHPGDDVRLRNGLIEFDWQGMVAISLTLKCLRNEKVARHQIHCFEHSLIADVVIRAQTLDHSFARNTILSLSIDLP